jgi:beta-lactamase class A
MMEGMMIDRRNILAGGAALIAAGCAVKVPAAQQSSSRKALAALEAGSGGRLGVYILDTSSGKSTSYRPDERFGMCSTFKLALAAIILLRGANGSLNLQTVLPYTKTDLMPNSPVTSDNVAAGGMSVIALAEATQKTSDNTAANLLMRHLGGPAALTAIFRNWRDDVTRFDRYEPEMNNVPPGEVRDTTSPRAFAQTMAKLLTGDEILPAAQRETLIGWMIDTETGVKRIRAGLPSSWKSGDKTGTGWSANYNNKTNDVAIFWPPSRPPVIVTAYFEADGSYQDIRDVDQAVLASVGRIAAAQAVEWHGGLD